MRRYFRQRLYSPADEENSMDLADQEPYEALAYLRFVARLRPLAYSNEFGEAFRHYVPRIVVPLYALSIGYIAADITIKTQDVPPDERLIKCLDTTLWHSIASIGLPTLAVNRTVALGRWSVEQQWCRASIKLLMEFFVEDEKAMVPALRKANKLFPVVLGLSIIPFIIDPIDHFTDWLMDNTIRRE